MAVEAIDFERLKRWLKPRPNDFHKGMAGHVLIVGGAPGYFGAPLMAGEAALRAGAGLVSVATWPENAANISIQCPELMGHAIASPQQLQPLLDKANIVVLGPGLGQLPWSTGIWKMAISQSQPMVIDADGLNLLAIENSSDGRDNWVLTPHPGEAARLLKKPVEQIQQDRMLAVTQIVKHYGGTCVLKGAGSLIATSDQPPVICHKGNPGMATGGMGDVLSGLIGGLMAQGVPPFEAAQLGVYIHAWAGDLAAAEGGERGIIATDLLSYIHHLCNPAD